MSAQPLVTMDTLAAALTDCALLAILAKLVLLPTSPIIALAVTQELIWTVGCVFPFVSREILKMNFPGSVPTLAL